MHAASRHGTPSLTSLPKDGGVSCFLVIHLEGRPSSFRLYTAVLNFSEANGFGWTAWPLTPHVSNRRGEVIEGGVYVGQCLIEGRC